jgi:hypothetical protein
METESVSSHLPPELNRSPLPRERFRPLAALRLAVDYDDRLLPQGHVVKSPPVSYWRRAGRQYNWTIVRPTQVGYCQHPQCWGRSAHRPSCADDHDRIVRAIEPIHTADVAGGNTLLTAAVDDHMLVGFEREQVARCERCNGAGDFRCFGKRLVGVLEAELFRRRRRELARQSLCRRKTGASACRMCVMASGAGKNSRTTTSVLLWLFGI